MSHTQLRIINKEEKLEWEFYYKNVLDKFNVVTGKTVLEIGPFMGYITEMIKYYKGNAPITLVEPNNNACEHLRAEYPTYEVICQDAFHYLETPRKFDVVVCFGVLYHLHSPLYLLELIVNRASPKIVMIETTGANVPSIEYSTELDNTPGMRYTDSEWKSVNKSICLPERYVIESMMAMGYKMTHIQYGLPEYPGPKRGTTLFIFELQ